MVSTAFAARWARAALVAAVMILGVGALSPAVSNAQTGGRVGAAGTGLTLDGQPWWPAGFNAYQLATDWSINHGCGAQVDLDAYFSDLPPRTVTRFNAFEALATNKTTGQRDWRPIDRVFEAAQRHGQLLVPVMAGQEGPCEDEQFKQHDWYIEGWKTQQHGLEPSFQSWIGAVVDRYKNSSALAAWETVGEPEPGVCIGDCVLRVRICPPDAAVVLRNFMDEAGEVIRRHAPGELITAGLVGGGQCGSAGEEYKYVNDSPNVDVLQYHDYHFNGIPLPGDIWNGLEVRIRQARELNKPIVVGEIGQMAGAPCETLEQRAADVDHKIGGQRLAGTAGAMLWSFVPDPRHDLCTFDVGPGDPLFGVLAKYTTVGSVPPPIPDPGTGGGSSGSAGSSGS
ncbi:beta-mannosidase [Rhodococcus sp. NPDC058505]|uniref:beta-mannosidase n=1 Tax=Rhodococcus sp. NPDC058505 TaxID=3346531 RepID=UPI00366A4507